MLDGRVLEASQVEYKPFGNPSTERATHLTSAVGGGAAGQTRLSDPSDWLVNMWTLQIDL